ncbi:hypothetical protein F5884DRAFT_781998 [Xylogone sp. PMI_703]|nr:hypothetical protein F5884DRAFT_781998 [Xylogone sp. PMI_703]
MNHIPEIDNESREMPSSTSDVYPLSFDRRLLETENLRQDTLVLESKLSSIRQSCSESLQCPSPISECPEHMSQMVQAYREFYLSDEPDRWYSNIQKYKDELNSMFNNPEEYTLADIHNRARKELRKAQGSDLCTIRPDDAEEIIKWKHESATMLDQGKPIAEIIDYRINVQLEALPESEATERMAFLKALEESKDQKERARIYIDYYCQQLPTDSREQSSLKAKFIKMFQEGAPHDTVLTAMIKQTMEAKEAHKSNLEHMLGELQMAQSAHLKNKAKKEETFRRRQQVEAEKTAECSFPGCDAPVNLLDKDGPLECAICEWLSQRSPTRKPYFYCSNEHADKDFPEHDRTQHGCIMGDKCLYAPLPGPPEDSITGGVCQDCRDHEIVSYFCSQSCYKENLDAHRADIHMSKDIESHSDTLDLFEHNV